MTIMKVCQCGMRNSFMHKIETTEDLEDDHIMNEAKYALKELIKLSETRIYETLELKRIKSAYKQEGIFYCNTVMTIELSSPYFVSGNQTEDFEIILMHHKDDNIKSIAIDEFPIMDLKVARLFLEIKINGKRKEREMSFRRLELQVLLFDNFYLDDNSGTSHDYDNLKDIPSLLESLDNQSLKELRKRYSTSLQNRLRGQQLVEEKELTSLSLSSLYQISIKEKGASDYQIERAIKLLDLTIAQLQLEKIEKRIDKPMEEAIILDNGDIQKK